MKKLLIALAVLASSLAHAQTTPQLVDDADWVDVGLSPQGDRYQVDKKFIKVTNNEKKEFIFAQRLLVKQPQKMLSDNDVVVTASIIFSKIQCTTGKSQMLLNIFVKGTTILAVNNIDDPLSLPEAGSVHHTMVGAICGREL